MTVKENARFTCDRLVSEYLRKGSSDTSKDYWGMLSYIANSFTQLGAITESEVERYCYLLNVELERLLEAPTEYKLLTERRDKA